MAWSDNVRCLYCDGKLPLYRKITSGQFCSAVHRKSYWQDQERLAVERLHQTHDSLRAYRSPEALEAILGKPAASEPISVDKYYLAGQPPEPESITGEEIARSAANTGNVRFAGFLTEEKFALRAWNALLAAWDTECAQWPMSAPELPTTATDTPVYAPRAAHLVAAPRFNAAGLAAQIRAAAEKEQSAEFSAKLIAQVPFVIAPETEELSQAFLESLIAAEIAAESERQAASAPEAPFAARMAPLPKFSTQPAPIVIRGDAPQPQQAALESQNARLDADFASPAVASATMSPLAMTNTPRTLAARAGASAVAQPVELNTATGAPSLNFALTAAVIDMQPSCGIGYPVLSGTGVAPAKWNAVTASQARALELRSGIAGPSMHVASPSLELRLRPAPGCRYAVQSQPGSLQSDAARSAGGEISIAPAPVRQAATQSLELRLGIAGPREYAVQSAAGTVLPTSSVNPLVARSDLRVAALPGGLVKTILNPAMAGIRPLAFKPTACAPAAPLPRTQGVDHTYAANTPMKPAGKWEPVEGSPTPQRHGILAAFGGSQGGTHAWTHAAEFWQNAPRDLKLLAFAIPILLGLTLRPSLPKVRVTAPEATGEISRSLGDGFRAQFVNVRNSVAQRAAVALSEDFRSGLDEWQTRGDISTTWAFDANGFVKPVTLALYRPSLGLRDYNMEFLGLIDKKALSWVVRAKDFDNYYVVKLVVTKAGPLPTLGITRYAVIGGKAQAAVNTVAAINARPDMLYRVTLNVHDDSFLLSMQDTVVDNWTETRLKSGGVGFFTSRGEQSRLRWLQVTHQYDMLGRLCAYLAPYNIPTTDGSW